MGYISPRGEQSTTAEIALLEALNNLATSGSGEAIKKTGAASFANVSVGFTVETPTGTVNGVNTTFTVTNEPKFVVIDGMIRFDGLGYTYAAGTIEVDPLIPPTSFIRSIY
ncbi:hypothetical protein C4544_05200 [candidate division WS5 bacterium]|uniref:Uncharacterized protein n=1 Tax=candidate division WS5 bacterium TaxID=2093353 RepID=A0A419DBC9_9BACT|nr:MAG: hypothetical protein C4544_05200 [candidate division WS5 bacterium]